MLWALQCDNFDSFCHSDSFDSATVSTVFEIGHTPTALSEELFFFKVFGGHMSFLGPLVPLFCISGDVSSGFQSHSGFCLICYFCGGKCNVHSPRFLPTSWWPARSWLLPHMHVQRWDLAQIRTCNRTNRRRTRYHCASDPAYVGGAF